MGNRTKRIDDRTPEQKKDLRWLVTATDKFLSGWGEAQGGLSKCAWACTHAQVKEVEAWLRGRRDMGNIRTTTRPWYPRAKHVHIYVVDSYHPINQKKKKEEKRR